MKIPESKLAVQMYTLRDYCKDSEALRDTMLRVKNMGYDAVQLSGVVSLSGQEYKQILDDTHLYCCATHESYKALLEGSKSIVEKLKIIDCPFTAVGSAPGEYFAPGGIDKLVPEMETMAKILKSEGIQFGYHNHGVEFNRFGRDRIMLEELYEKTDPELVCAELDTYWIQFGGGDPVQWIYKVGNRMPLIHFKDMMIMGEGWEVKHTITAIGEGNLNWEGIIQACEETGVRWYAIEMDTYEGDPFKGLENSLKYLQSLGVK